MIRLVLCALLAGCSGSHSADDAGAAATAIASDDCAPDDGQALRIRISDAITGCDTDPAEPSLEFYIFSGAETVFPIEPGETVTSDNSGAFGNGSATQCPGGTPPCRTSQNWSITFDAFEDDERASGTYSIDFEGETVTGSFDATFCGSPPACG